MGRLLCLVLRLLQPRQKALSFLLGHADKVAVFGVGAGFGIGAELGKGRDALALKAGVFGGKVAVGAGVARDAAFGVAQKVVAA